MGLDELGNKLIDSNHVLVKESLHHYLDEKAKSQQKVKQKKVAANKQAWVCTDDEELFFTLIAMGFAQDGSAFGCW